MNANKNVDRHVLSIGEPPLYVLIDPPENFGVYARGGPSWIRLDERVRRVHVMSPAARGEIRSYWFVRGGLYHADCHPMEWPEVDAEVARVAGVPIKGWGP